MQTYNKIQGKTQEMIEWEKEHGSQMCLADFDCDIEWGDPGIGG